MITDGLKKNEHPRKRNIFCAVFGVFGERIWQEDFRERRRHREDVKRALHPAG